MKRRDFVSEFLVGGTLLKTRGFNISQRAGSPPQGVSPTLTEGVFVERAASGKPHAGKVLAAIQPHTDDIPIFAGGTVAKLVGEGYTGYLIRTTNDEMAGSGTTGQRVLDNERDTENVAKALGLQKVFNLEYRNHQMDEISRVEMRARLVHLIRFLKIDTIVCYDPWGIRDRSSGGSRLLDGGNGPRLSRADGCRLAAACCEGKILFRARATNRQPRCGHFAVD